MAWLQNLAGHAENLLNKIDQNAATVLNDPNKQNSFVNVDEEKPAVDAFNEPEKYTSSNIARPASIPKFSASSSPVKEILNHDKLEKMDEVLFMAISESQKSVIGNDENTLDKSVKTDHSSMCSNSLLLANQELENLQGKLVKLELENQEVNKQLLNMQHLYSEMRNENANLQVQVERLNEQLSLAQNEKEQYVIRAQRILQEKEKLISVKQTVASDEDSEKKLFDIYKDEIKKDLEFQQEKVKELTEKNSKLLQDLQSLQMQHQIIQNGLSQSNESLEQSLLNEKKYRSIAEEDCVQKNKEVQIKMQEVLQLQELVKVKNEENDKLKELLAKKPEHTENEEYESRLKSLTQTLMFKQNTLETTTTERNALRLQIEKLEAEYKKTLAELKRDKVRVISVQETSDERFSVPHFMRISPYDSGVKRRVKHAYSTLDAISVRTGIFLRRYPLARVFVFSYMVILHVWVLTVLLWDVPSS